MIEVVDSYAADSEVSVDEISVVVRLSVIHYLLVDIVDAVDAVDVVVVPEKIYSSVLLFFEKTVVGFHSSYSQSVQQIAVAW